MPAPTENQTTTLRRAAAGDRAALGEMFMDVTEAIWPLCRRSAAGRVADAEDLLQETCLRAVRSMATYDPERPLGAWLRAILASVVADRGRSARNQAARRRAALERGQPVGAAPGAELESRDELDRLLEGLDEMTRLILTLRYAQGMSREEIAAETGLGVDAVKKRLQRGRATLREQLGGEDTHEENPGSGGWR